MKRILVTNAGGRLGMSVSRALKSAPEPLYLIGVDTHEVQIHRAVTDEKHLVPRADEEDYIPVLCSIVEETRPDLLWINHEREIAVVSRMADAAGFQTFLPSYETVALCQDKMASNERFREAGVPAPESIIIRTKADLRRAFREIGDRLWLRAIKGTGGKGSLPVSDLDIARRWIDFHRGWGTFMAAPQLSSHTITWESIWHQGQLIAVQGRKRLYWEFPSMTFSGVTGVGGAHQWVSDPLIDRLGTEAVRAIAPQPHGIFSVDMTYDWQGDPLVTEINGGRFMSGGVVCFVTADCNMPYLAVQKALGESPEVELPLLNPLPQDVILIHGVDTDPVVVDIHQVQGCVEGLRQRKERLGASAITGPAPR